MKKHLIFLFLFLIFGGVVSAQQPAPNKEITGVPDPRDENMAELQKIIAEQKGVLEDWPNLARYRDANATLPLPEKGQMRVVFMGDSITEGWSIPAYGGFFPGKPYVNRGISGQTTPQMLLRFRSDVINLQPKVVLILAGINDLAGNTGVIPLEETEGNLASMAELAHASRIRVILCSVIPVSDNIVTSEGKHLIQTESHPPQSILQLNAWLKKYAAEHGHIYLDYFSVMADAQGFLKNEFTMDGLHPDAAGYSVMAPLAQRAIDQALKENP